MAVIETLAISTDNVVTVVGMTDDDGVLLESGAQVRAKVERLDGTDIPRSAFVLTYTGTPGSYQGILRATAEMNHGERYRLVFIAVSDGRTFTVVETRDGAYMGA